MLKMELEDEKVNRLRLEQDNKVKYKVNKELVAKLSELRKLIDLLNKEKVKVEEALKAEIKQEKIQREKAYIRIREENTILADEKRDLENLLSVEKKLKKRNISMKPIQFRKKIQ